VPIVARSVRSLLVAALAAGLLAASASTAVGTQLHADPGRFIASPALARVAGGIASGVAVRPIAIGSLGIAPALGARSLEATAAWMVRPHPSVPTPRATAVAKRGSASATTRSTSAVRTSFHGRNHVWIPTLGIDRSVTGYSCSSTYYPGNRVYRWGCGGTNNVYLFGHAHSVFKPLHDAYVRGRLKKGMKVYFAGANGSVATYAVSWWKITTPTKGTWAYASLARPSMTLQTCVGADSQFRLIVRLTRVA
jgi:sortase (surface protein transpeptidase)